MTRENERAGQKGDQENSRGVSFENGDEQTKYDQTRVSSAEHHGDTARAQTGLQQPVMQMVEVRLHNARTLATLHRLPAIKPFTHGPAPDRQQGVINWHAQYQH